MTVLTKPELKESSIYWPFADFMGISNWYIHLLACVVLLLVMYSKSNPITGLDRPRGFQEVEALRFQDNRHMKVVRLSDLRTGRLYPPGNTPGTHYCYRLSQPQGHSVAGRIMSMKNSNDTIENRTRDLPACSAVPQTTASLANITYCTFKVSPQIKLLLV